MIATHSTHGTHHSQAAKTFQVLVVDDHDAMRKALVELIEAHDGMAVCAATASAEEAVDLFAVCRPDAAVVDVAMPGMNGIELTAVLHQHFPEMPVVVVSSHPPSRYEQAALDAGARAYLVKREAAAHLVEVLQQALDPARPA